MLEVVINRCDSDGVSPSVSLQSRSQGQSCTWNFQSAETKKQKVLNWWFSSILRLETFTGDEKNSVKVSNFFSIHNFNMIKTQTDRIIVWTLHWQNTIETNIVKIKVHQRKVILVLNLIIIIIQILFRKCYCGNYSINRWL